MISFSLNCDPMNIPLSRNEEDIEDMFTDDFFWIHERGVDYSFIFIYAHMYRKLFIGSFTKKQEGAWKTGSLLLLLLHLVTFLGLVLCCTHLSEVTLTIAANMMHSITAKYGKIYWWIFPKQELNTDTIMRLMYAHYLSALALLFIAIYHALEMHYDWKDSANDEKQKNDFSWLDDGIKNELLALVFYVLVIHSANSLLYSLSEPLCTELFMWGDVGSVAEIRFYGVTPHWYFRAYMSWLIVCPHHYMGLGGLVFFMIIIYFQPQIKTAAREVKEMAVWGNSLIAKATTNWFAISILYGLSYLPYGKFFNRLGGNKATTVAFAFILIYLAIPIYWLLTTLFFVYKKTIKSATAG